MIALAAALLSLCWFAAAPGKPPSAEEARLFEEGMRAFQAGNPHEADKAWRAGYAVGKDPAFLVRMGEAEEKAGQTAEAVDSYRRYLRAAPDAADRPEIEQRLARLAPATEGAPGTPPAAGPPETPGSFGGGGAAPGPAGSATPPPAPAAIPAPAQDDETARRLGDAEERGWTPFNITAWIATGTTVLLLGTAAYFAASAGSEKDDVNRLLRYQDQMTGAPLEYHTVADQYQTAIHDGQRHDRLAKGTLVAAAGTAVVATVFFILDAVLAPDEKSGPAERARAQASPSTIPRLGLEIVPGNRAAALSSLRWSF